MKTTLVELLVMRIYILGFQQRNKAIESDRSAAAHSRAPGQCDRRSSTPRHLSLLDYDSPWRL